MPSNISTLRALIISDHRSFGTAPLMHAIIERLETVKLISVDEKQYSAAIVEAEKQQDQFDLVLCFLGSRHIFAIPGLFSSIKIPVILIEHDACQNFISVSQSHGMWSRYFKDNPVTAICVSGNTAYNGLKDTIPSQVIKLYKAAPESFFSSPISRNGCFCLFGSLMHTVYAERKALYDEICPLSIYNRIMMKVGQYQISYAIRRILEKRPIVNRVRFPRTEAHMMNVLKNYSATIICDRGLGEPMGKHFEASALGLAVFRDNECEAELEELGYRHGESMVVYKDVTDLKEKIDFYAKNPDKLYSIQLAAREVTREHTWKKRADQLLRVIAQDVL